MSAPPASRPSLSRPSRRVTRLAPPPLPERSGGFVQAITIDQEIWQAFGESEEAIQDALRKLVASMKKKTKTKSEPGLLDAWKTLFTPGKTRPKRASKKKPTKTKKRR